MVTIIQIEPGTDGLHDVQSQSGFSTCWLPGYIEVPSSLQSIAEDSGGYCDLTIEGGVLVGVTPTERPAPEPEPVAPMTTEEAALDAIADLSYRMDLQTLGLTEGV